MQICFAQSELISTYGNENEQFNSEVFINVLTDDYTIYRGKIDTITRDSLFLKVDCVRYAFSTKQIISVGDRNDFFRKERKNYRYPYNRMMLTASDGMLEKKHVEVNSYFFLLFELKYGINKWWTIGTGISLIPETNEVDSSTTLDVSNQFYLFSNKIRIIHNKRFTLFYKGLFIKPPTYRDDSTGFSFRYPWISFHFLGASYKVSKFNFVFTVGQPLWGPVRWGKVFFISGVTTTGVALPVRLSNIQYFASASCSFDLSRKFSLINENIFYSSIWNTPSSLNMANRPIEVIPMIGGRFYTGSYTYGGGISLNVVNDGMIYLEGAYVF